MIYNVQDLEYLKFKNILFETNKTSIHYASVVTFGCQQNEADSEKIRGILIECGYTITDNIDLCELVIFNTCAVREHAEKKALSIIGKLKAKKTENKDFIIGVLGCMAASSTTVELIKKSYHFISFTLEPNMLHKLPEIISSYKASRKRMFPQGQDTGDIVEGLPVIRRNSYSAYVSIMYGCNNFCAYCIVPYTRGRERSRRSADILAECQELVSSGIREITLLGQNVNSYKSDIDFAELLENIANIEGDFWIRFMTSHPKDVPDKLIDLMGKYKEKLVPFFHLPLQSGSNTVLRAMNRGYTRERYLETIDKLKKTVPGIALSTDIIVGFPGESDDDFSDTIDVISRVKYDNVYSFIYSKRSGTPAANMVTQVPKALQDSRMSVLLSLCQDIAYENNLKYEGKILKALVDGVTIERGKCIYSARSAENKLIHIESDKDIIGSFVLVKIEKAKPYDLIGVLVR